jgi:hypothetical protein
VPRASVQCAAMAKPAVIRALDEARTSWFHVVVVIVAGMGCVCVGSATCQRHLNGAGAVGAATNSFFTDAYDLFKCVARAVAVWRSCAVGLTPRTASCVRP